jgi:hypothetical protein
MVLSDEDENADDSIRVNRELDSNKIDESDSQYEKYDHLRISTFHAISLTQGMNHQMLTIRFELALNVIQMKLVKVIDKMRNIMTQVLNIGTNHNRQ